MRILKYLFLLLLLFLISVSVFVATSKGTFSVERSRIINLPRPVVFSYASDFRNWENFGTWPINKKEARFDYPAMTSGKGASYSWESSEGDGKVKTLYVKENDSLFQRMEFNGALSDISWKFKDTVGGTKVTWRGKGRMSFMYKVKAVAEGGIEKLISALSEQSLIDLDKTLQKEIATFKVIPNGIKDLASVGYLQQTISSKIDLAPSNIRIMLAKMYYFFKKNKLEAAGNPFVIYDRYDGPNNHCRFSVCMPIAEEVHISDGSDIQYAEIPKMSCAKVTLTGDLSHLPEARKKATEYLTANNLVALPKYRWIEVITKGINQTNRPSQWITELYYPVGVYDEHVVTDSTLVQTPTLPVQRPAATVRDTAR
ncbi:SRPBCC family protein [Flavobacterium silvaticum]|uniref:Transcriptional regulator n=1 Tax=Flavobacterium silvaticum TaxID=1852020 RepID=A0A972FYT6_9FLAO|nr:GyrI-like domain-containing protein [Flavobacterium silvaticum]NMH27321.1 transcriptional regulator [Flavobacterium silvaticum]